MVEAKNSTQSDIPFAELCANYLKVPEFAWKVKAQNMLWTLQQRFEISKGKVLAMAELLREMRCIDYITSISHWWNLSPDEMIDIQEGVFREWEAFNTYAKFVSRTCRMQDSIDEITTWILNKKRDTAISDAKQQVRDGARVIQGPWGI